MHIQINFFTSLNVERSDRGGKKITPYLVVFNFLEPVTAKPIE